MPSYNSNSISSTHRKEALPPAPDSDILCPAYRLLSPVKRSVAAKLSGRCSSPTNNIPGPGSYDISYSWSDKPCCIWRESNVYMKKGNNNNNIVTSSGRNPYGDIRIPTPTSAPYYNDNNNNKEINIIYKGPIKGYSLSSRHPDTTYPSPGPGDYVIPSDFDKYSKMKDNNNYKKNRASHCTFGSRNNNNNNNNANNQLTNVKDNNNNDGVPGPGTYYTPLYNINNINNRLTDSVSSIPGFSISVKWHEGLPKPAPGPNTYYPTVPGVFPTVPANNNNNNNNNNTTGLPILPSMMKGVTIKGRLAHPMDDSIVGHNAAKTSLPYHPERRIRARVRA